MTAHAAATASATLRTVSAMDRASYVEEHAKRYRPLQLGAHVAFPIVGGAFVSWQHGGERAFRGWDDVCDVDCERAGSVELRVGRCLFQADMPDHWFKDTSDRERRMPAAIWYASGLPFLIVAGGLKAMLRTLADPFRWRLKRAGLRLAWRLRPTKMDGKVAEWRAAQEAGQLALRLLQERWAAEETAREAAFEAEVERRLAERLAAAGA